MRCEGVHVLRQAHTYAQIARDAHACVCNACVRCPGSDTAEDDRATTQKRVHYQLGRQAIYLVQNNSRPIPTRDWLIKGGRIHQIPPVQNTCSCFLEAILHLCNRLMLCQAALGLDAAHQTSVSFFADKACGQSCGYATVALSQLMSPNKGLLVSIQFS